MAYNPPAQPPAITGRRRGGRRVTWFNPPYSMDVATNVAREFLELVDKHFPPGNPLHSICNRSTLKVSYRCLPNMGSVIARHNSKILRGANPQPKPKASCNCQNKPECPVPGECNQNGPSTRRQLPQPGAVQKHMLDWPRTSKSVTPSIRKIWWMSLHQGGQPYPSIFGRKKTLAGIQLFHGNF